MGRNPKRALALIAALAATAVAAPVANAGILVTSAESCDTQTYSQPFEKWLDHMIYTPVPGGHFEAGAEPWTLAGARVVSGNETHYVRSRSDTSSLSIPQGKSATSPAMCVGLDEPTLRFFAKQSAVLLGSATSTMAVAVEFETSLGLVVSAPVGVVAANSGWQPSLPMVVVANLLPLMPNDTTAVRFRFTAVTGNWQIDDVYVDPYRRA